jgi:formylglycine-generating enzyme required for sulfatase activity
MPDFGPYQPGQIIDRQALEIRHALDDSQSSDKVILEFNPEADLWNPARQRAAQSTFIARYDYQKLIAQQSTLWVRVFDFRAGDNANAYCVLERLDWPISRLIRLHVKPTGADLYHLTIAVLTALTNARKLTSRTHGNLRAENIFASGGSLASSRIALSNPASSVFDAGAVESDDLAQLGRVICELVSARRWTPSTPLDPAMAEFKSLGSAGRAWSEFCSFLLNKDLPPEQRNIPSALDRAGKLKPRKSRKPMYLSLAAVMMALVLAAIGYIRHVRTLAEMSRFNGAYAPYSAAYTQWFKAFEHDRGVLSKVPEFAPIHTALSHGIILNPDNILHEFTGLLSNQQIQKVLAAHPHESAKLGQAVVLLMRTERILGNLYPILQQQERRWQKRGWKSAALRLKHQVLAAMPKDQSLVPFLKLYKASWAAHPNLRRFASRSGISSAAQWLKQLMAARRVAVIRPKLTKLLAQFSKTDKPIIRTFPAYARHYLAESLDAVNLESRMASLLSVAQKQSQVLAAYGKQIRWDLVAQLPPRSPTLAPEKYFPDLAGYRKLTAPENAYILYSARFNSEARKAQLRIAHALRLPKPPTVNYLAELRALRKQFNAVNNHNLWIWKNRLHIEHTVLGALHKLNTLNQTVVAFIDSQINVGKWTAKLLGFQPAGHHYRINPRILRISPYPAVNIAYLTKVTATIFAPAPAPISIIGSNQKSYDLITTALRRRRWQVPDISKRLQTISDNVRSILATKFSTDLPDSLTQSGSPWIKAAITDALEPAQAAIIQKAFAKVSWSGTVPIISDKTLAVWVRQRRTFRELLSDFNRINTALRQCRLPQHTLSPGVSISTLYATARKNPWWNNAKIQVALRPTVAFLKQLDAISTATAPALPTDYRRALSAADNKTLVVRAIWQRLAAIPALPGTSLLTLERQIPMKLNHLVQATSGLTPNRRQALLKKLSRQYVLRWQQRMNQARNAAMISQTISAAADYRVMLTHTPRLHDLTALKSLTPQSRFNILLYQFSMQSAGVKVPQIAQKLASRMHQLLSQALSEPAMKSLRDVSEVAAFNHGLQAVMKAKQNRTQQPSGPALAGWKQVKMPDHGRKFTSPSGDHTLTFRLMNPNSGRPFYLCTTDLSVGDFLYAVNSSHNLIHKPSNSFYNLIKPNSNYFGPHTWVYKQTIGQVQLAKHWFTNTNQIYNAPRYPKNMLAKGGKHISKQYGGPPTLNDPVQYLPPKAAVYVAALLGCRLPTAREWQYAYQVDGGGKTASAHLAGKTLATYVAYLKHVNSTRDARLPTPRYWDLYSYAAPALAPFRDQYGTSKNPILWFEPVASSQTQRAYIHLVGNVAVYVFDDSANYHKALKGWFKNPASLNSGAMNKLLATARLKNLFVIGASALSPLGTRSPAAPAIINWRLRRTGRGFADVGLRLAYNPRVLTPQELLAELVRRNWYLVSESQH